ncbi:B3 domain-containing protein Os11g0197600 [Euphorbia peplus]|nr:B3 domain-containing protein Os11g0197600 [Euphorbia peplus]
MACKNQKGHDQSFDILGTNPKFFKTIAQDIIQDGRLALPRKFVKDYGDLLSSRVFLQVADGTIWQMELLKGENYGAWLQKGWKEFERHYSLKHGSLLLFKYEEKSKFLVFVFDVNLVEIQYPRQSSSSTPDMNGVIMTEDSDSENLAPAGISDKSNGKRVLQAADVPNTFSSTNPWFKFVLNSQQKGKEKFFAVNIPHAFVREHMDRKLETVNLKIEGVLGRWPAKLIVNWKNNFGRLTAGWYDFAKDNNLKTKDVCVLELVARDEFKVHIFRCLSVNA